MKSADKRKQQPLVIAICGVKNSGKTTCMEGLITILSEKGYKVSAIKHDGHEFQADVPGTDSYRMQQAGAFGTAVFSQNQLLVYKKTQADIQTLIGVFPESDLILVEGMKESELLKYEIIRHGISEEPVSNPVGRMGILTDIPKLLAMGKRELAENESQENKIEEAKIEKTKIFNLNNLQELAEELIERIKYRREDAIERE